MNSCLSLNSLFNHFLQNKECNYPNGWNTCKIGHFLQRRQNIGSNLDVADPTKIVFAIMVSSLYKKLAATPPSRRLFLLVPAESFLGLRLSLLNFELSYDRFAVTPQL